MPLVNSDLVQNACPVQKTKCVMCVNVFHNTHERKCKVNIAKGFHVNPNLH